MNMSGADPIQRLDSNDEEIDVDEVEEPGYTNGALYDQVYEMAEKCAGTYVGQYVTGKVDILLKLIEDTAKWSLPPNNKNESSTPLKRPLPWIPFIALILILRLIRIGLSIAGLFIGNAPLVPSDVVYFIQTRRRKLRAIRIAGMKEISNKSQTQGGHKQRKGFVSSLTSIMSMAMCRPKLGEDSDKIFLNDNCIEEAGSSGVNKIQQNHNSSKNKCFEDEDDSLTFGEILDKYGASSNEDDDSDFVPPSDALNEVDTSITSTSSAISDEDKNNEEEIESNENQPVQTISNNNPDSNVYKTNGNISIESHELSMEAKENGEHLDTKLRKPKIMPKPIKEEPMPFPIQEIKQEPVDSDEDTIRNRIEFENSEDLNISNDYKQHQQEQSIVELDNDCKGLNNKDINENGKDRQIEKINGDQKLSQPSEMFVTPATSAEDLFFSPVGSPDLCGTYGFQPTSILKNCEAVHLEKRGRTDVFAKNEDFIKGERTNETAATSKPTKSTHHPGKPIKNKFRGKRR